MLYQVVSGNVLKHKVKISAFLLPKKDGMCMYAATEGLNPSMPNYWPRMLTAKPASNTWIDYVASGIAWFASGGKAARVFYSDDFGKSWQVKKTPMIRGEAASGIFSVAFTNDREGAIVGGIYDHPELNTNIAAYTIDGGKNWLQSETMPKGYRSCVQAVEYEGGNFWFAIGKTGCDISSDGGRSWTFLSDEGYYTFRAVPGQAAGFAAGANGKISRVRFQ